MGDTPHRLVSPATASTTGCYGSSERGHFVMPARWICSVTGRLDACRLDPKGRTRRARKKKRTRRLPPIGALLGALESSRDFAPHGAHQPERIDWDLRQWGRRARALPTRRWGLGPRPRPWRSLRLIRQRGAPPGRCCRQALCCDPGRVGPSGEDQASKNGKRTANLVRRERALFWAARWWCSY